MNVQEAGKVLAYISMFYPHVVLDESAAVVWADMFEPYAYADVMSAAKMACRSSTYFPSVAEIFDFLVERDDRTPDQVWSGIRQQIGNVGTKGNPTLTKLEAATVGELGGWRVMCQSDEDKLIERMPRAVAAAKKRLRHITVIESVRPLDRSEVVMIGDGDADD